MVEEQYLKMVKGFGLYHALAILPLTIPVVSDKFIFVLGTIHNKLGLMGEWVSVNISQMMFINLFACAALVWAIYRVLYPSYAAGKIEGWGMLLFSVIVIYYVLQGASPIWLVVPLVDLPGGMVHLYYAEVKSA